MGLIILDDGCQYNETDFSTNDILFYFSYNVTQESLSKKLNDGKLQCIYDHEHSYRGEH